MVIATLLSIQVGCSPRDELSRYSIPKKEALQRPLGAAAQGGPATDRMLVALVPRGDHAWFFKLSGLTDAVAKEAGNFRTFLESVRLAGADGAQPTWELPEGWRLEQESGIRYATIKIDSAQPPLELSVTRLPTEDASDKRYLLSNINRWREQMSLPAISEQQLPEQTVQLQLEGAIATLVDLEGRLAGTMPGQPPFAPFASSQTFPSDFTAQPSSDRAPSSLVYKAPSTWKKAAGTSFSKAAFDVTAGQQKVSITVTDLAASAGDLLANVNRWRLQIQLPEVTLAQLKEQVRKIPVDKLDGDYVELVGPADAQPRQTILGVIVTAEDKAWFIKLTGDSELAEREKPNFEAFVRSLKFNKADGAGDGK